MEDDTVKNLPYEELKLCTNNFSEDNLIGTFQFGKIYRGYYGAQGVTVKKWDRDGPYRVSAGENECRLQDEILLLHRSELSSHPNLVKLIGYYCGKEEPCTIYDLNPLDGLYNVIQHDSFTWLRRIKVILGFASLLESMHAVDPPRLIRNINADHIMLDQDYNPKLVDFGRMTGGIFRDRRFEEKYLLGCIGESDVFAFGVVLKMIIPKRNLVEEDKRGDRMHINEWTNATYKPKCSLVNKSLMVNPGFYGRDGRKITKLAVDCTNFEVTVKDVVNCLLSLRVVRFHADFLGVDKVLQRRNMK